MTFVSKVDLLLYVVKPEIILISLNPSQVLSWVSEKEILDG